MIKKVIACKCGTNNSFEFSSDMNVEEVSVQARCPSCQAAVNISLSSLLSPPSQNYEIPEVSSLHSIDQPASKNESEVQENVEQAVRDLFK